MKIACYDSLDRLAKPASRREYYLAYSCVFVIVSLLVFAPFLWNGKSFVFCDTDLGGDGLVQHFNAFCYYGKYLRGIIKTLVEEHSLVIPMWDMNIGYGQDIITTLSYYVIGDPFSLLSVIIPKKHAELGYCILIIARLYCAGLAFSVYCRYRGWKSYNVLIGALIYVFCYYGLFASVLHPYFVLPMIWLPLLFKGVDMILKGEGFLHYVLAFAIAGISNFYFFYMLCILIFIYAIIRYFELYPKRGLKFFFASALRVAAFSALGAGMAAILLIPSLLNVLSASRVHVDNHIPILYNIEHYLRMVPAFVNGGYGSYTYLGFSGFGIIGTTVMFLKSKERRDFGFLAFVFMLFLAFLSIPFFGHVFNGFGYVTNRWVWAFSFLVSYIVVITLPLIRELSARERRVIVAVAFLVSLLILVFYQIRNEKNILVIVELGAAIGVLVYHTVHKRESFLVLSSLALTVVFVCSHAFYLYSPTEENYLQYFADRGEALNLLEKEAPGYVLNGIDDDTIYRFDTAAIGTGAVKRNSAMQLKRPGIAYYFSTTNSAISSFTTDMKLNYSMDQSFNNLDRRCVLQHLAGVKYFIIPEGFEQFLPFGYDEKVLTKNNLSVYRSSNALPLGFTSSSFFKAEDFDCLDVVSKENALLKGIVVETDVDLEPVSIQSIDGGRELDWRVDNNGLALENNDRIIVTEPESILNLSFEEVKGEELYLIIDGLSFEGRNPLSEEVMAEATSEMSRIEKLAYVRENSSWKEPTSVSINATSGAVSSMLNYKTPRDNYYCGHDSFVVNLGYSETGRNGIALSFSKPGTYSFTSLRIVAVNREHIVEEIDKLRSDTLSDVKMGANSVSGSISLQEPKLLCLQLPFSNGWSATVDGNDATILKADGMYMAIFLEEGNHVVRFSYQTPYLLDSSAISLAFFIICIIGFILNRRRAVRAC